MDKILSARVDEEVLQKINIIAHKLKTTKKSVIESAIQVYAEKIEKEEKIDLLELTLGAWKRDESPDESIKTIKNSFERSMDRYQK